MDYQQTLDDNFSDSLSINGDIRIFLKETAKWAQFIAIVGLVIMGLFLLIIVLMGTVFGSMAGSFPGGEDLGAMPGLIGGFGMLLYALFLAMFIFPLVYLLRFAQNTKKALKSDNQEALVLAFQNLKSHYKFYGIFMAIMVGFYALVFLFSLIVGVGATF